MTAARRLVLAGGAAFVALAAWRSWSRGRAPEASFRPVAGMPGFRALDTAAGSVSRPSGAGAALIGLAPPEPPDPRIAADIQANPCLALYGSAPQPALAYFTDIRCPICRVQESDLADLSQARPDLTQVTHEYPVFGASSEFAARALVAADPDLRPRLRVRLQRLSAVVLNAAILEGVIAGLGADPSPVLAAMDTAAVTETLARSAALARAFGFAGTPALVVGGTAVLGRIDLPTLTRIAELETARPGPCPA
ncbi:MAG: DsbA family protein [Pseudomonadota bacterium]